MSRRRKTVEVAAYAAVLQRAILMPTTTSEQKSAIGWALENLLLSTGNYQGFMYVGGYRPDDPDFDQYLRSYYGVQPDLAGTVLDTPRVMV